MAKSFVFEVIGENLDRLEGFAKRVGVNKATIVNNALTLLEMAIEEVQEGVVIAAVNEETGGYKKLPLPILSAFAEAKKG